LKWGNLTQREQSFLICAENRKRKVRKALCPLYLLAQSIIKLCESLRKIYSQSLVYGKINLNKPETQTENFFIFVT
jgi:hypothetical protein